MHRPDYNSRYVYHIFNRGNRKKKIFYGERDYERFEKLLMRLSFLCCVKIGMSCLMPNHYHLAIVLDSESEVSAFMQRIGIAYTMYVNRRYRLVGHVFQGRYRVKEVRSLKSLERLTNYIKMNPVKDKIVTDWKYYRWLKIRSDILQDAKLRMEVAKNVARG